MQGESREGPACPVGLAPANGSTALGFPAALYLLFSGPVYLPAAANLSLTVAGPGAPAVPIDPATISGQTLAHTPRSVAALN